MISWQTSLAQWIAFWLYVHLFLTSCSATLQNQSLFSDRFNGTCHNFGLNSIGRSYFPNCSATSIRGERLGIVLLPKSEEDSNGYEWIANKNGEELSAGDFTSKAINRFLQVEAQKRILNEPQVFNSGQMCEQIHQFQSFFEEEPQFCTIEVIREQPKRIAPGTCQVDKFFWLGEQFDEESQTSESQLEDSAERVSRLIQTNQTTSGERKDIEFVTNTTEADELIEEEQLTLTAKPVREQFNFASAECGAKVLETNPEAMVCLFVSLTLSNLRRFLWKQKTSISSTFASPTSG